MSVVPKVLATYAGRERGDRLRLQKTMLEQQVVRAAEDADNLAELIRAVREVMRSGHDEHRVAAAMEIPHLAEDLNRAVGKCDKLRREVQDLQVRIQNWEILARMVQP